MANGLHGAAAFGTILVIALPVIAGVVATKGFQDEGRDAVREQVFATSCAQYKAASKWERWTTYDHWKMGWCEKYLERV